jgi:hypothetical protein
MNDTGEVSAAQRAQAIDGCLQAYKVCRQTATYCTHQSLALPVQLQCLQDCADLCLALANLLVRSSRFSEPLAVLCREVAATGAESISALEHEDAQFRAAYAACERVERVCGELLGLQEASTLDEQDVTLQESFPASDPPPPPTEL